MPIYTYQCDNCGYHFERTQKFTDAPVTVCPNCKKKRVRKLLSPPSIVFKGSGWYATDHRSPSGASSKKNSDGGSSESKSSEKSESKVSAASESKTGGDD